MLASLFQCAGAMYFIQKCEEWGGFGAGAERTKISVWCSVARVQYYIVMRAGDNRGPWCKGKILFVTELRGHTAFQ